MLIFYRLKTKVAKGTTWVYLNASRVQNRHCLLSLVRNLQGWFAKKLFHGGKEVPLKSIAMVLPVYAMSCFRLTKHHCQKIMSAMASFWLDEDGEKKKIHWIAWKKICVPKDKGGLGSGI